MENLSTSQKKNISLKKKCFDAFQKHKFPITIEPFAFFGSLAFGVIQVDRQGDKTNVNDTVFIRNY